MKSLRSHVFILIFLFSAKSYAQVETLSDRIDQLNEDVASHPNEEYCISCANQESTSQNYDMCIRQICPTGNGAYRVAEDRYGMLGYNSTPDVNRFDDILNPLLIEGGLKQGELHRAVLTRMKNLRSQNHSFTDPNVVRLINYFNFVSEHFEVVYYTQPNSNRDSVFNASEYVSHNLQMSAEERQNLETRAQAFINFRQQIESNFLHIQEMSFLNSEESVRSRTQHMLQEISNDSQWIRQQGDHPIYAELLDRFTRTFRQYRSGATIPADQIRDLQFEYLKVKEMRNLLEDPEIQQAFSGASVSASSLIDSRNFRHGIRGVIDNTPEQDFIEDTINFGWNNCRKALAMGEDLLPNQTELPGIRRSVERARVQFINKLQEKMSEESFPRIKSELEGVQIGLPPSKESHRNSLLMALIKNNLDLTRQVNKLTSENVSNDLVGVEFALTTYPDPRDTGPYNGDAVCSPYIINNFSDMAASISSENGFQISPITAANIENNKGVFAHEFSHILDMKLRSSNYSQQTNSWYEQSKECVGNAGGNNSKHVLAENWADWVTAQLQISDENMACGLVRSSRFGGMAKLQAESHSTHPPDFYRLIHMQAASGKELPQSCITAIQEKGLSQPDFSCVRASER